jgi:hypothetical protein
MRPGDLDDPATWAVVLDELLEDLLDESARAAARAVPDPRGSLRARLLLARARQAADRVVVAVRTERRPELRDAMDRLAFAVHSRHASPEGLEPLVRAVQRVARRHRPTGVTRIGAFVVGQLLRPRGRRGNTDAGD